MGKDDMDNKGDNKGGQPVDNKKETVEVAPTSRVMDTTIGLVNRRNHSITVVLKKDSFVLSPSARTGKDYKQDDIVSVNGLSLQRAVSSGLCAILR